MRLHEPCWVCEDLVFTEPLGASTERTLEPHGSLLLGAEGVCPFKVEFPLTLLTLFGQTLAVESLFYMAPGVVPTLT